MTNDLPPLPGPQGFEETYTCDGVRNIRTINLLWTAEQMRTYAEQYAAAKVAAERERCARVCEEYGDRVLDDSGVTDSCAAAIRSNT